MTDNMTTWVYRSDFYAPGTRGLHAQHIRKMLARDARKRREQSKNWNDWKARVRAAGPR